MSTEYNRYSDKFKHSTENEKDTISYEEKVNTVEASSPVEEDEAPKKVTPVKTEKPVEVAKPKDLYCKVNCDLLNIRAAADRFAAIKLVAKKDDKFLIVDERNGWCKIKLEDGSFAYCMRTFVTLE